MPRRPGDILLMCALTAEERAACDTMKAQCAIGSDANLVRIALWSLADEWDLTLGPGAFDCRHYQGRPRPRKVKPGTHTPARVYARPKRPAAGHPWRNRPTAAAQVARQATAAALQPLPAPQAHAPQGPQPAESQRAPQAPQPPPGHPQPRPRGARSRRG